MHLELRTILAISGGAIPGALCRYYLTGLCAQWFGVGFPYGTFLINLTGSMAMGLIITLLLAKVPLWAEARLFFAVGFLGSYTTFSTYALDSAAMLRSQHYFLSLFYWLGSAVLGVIGLELGSWAARRLI
jgi:CrcB protein